VPLHPYLGLRGGAKKVFGDFPFQEAAFIGGRTNVRTLDPQRYAGDASLYATAELRLPVARFTLLLPLNVGLLATEDIGRVYVKGASPDGWHNDFGAGFYVAFHDISVNIKVVRKYEVGRPAGLGLSFTVPGVLR
jgi:hemolysin activation/secretion protein